MDGQQNKTWQARAELQKLIDNAGLHDIGPDGSKVLWQDKAGHGVSVAALKGVLNALLTHYPNMYPSIDTLASRSGQRPRTVQRSIEVLQLREILAVETTRSSRGQKQNRYTILTTKLVYLGGDGRLPLFQPPREAKTQAPSEQGHAPWRTNPCALVDAPSAPGGALTVLTTRKDQTEQGSGARKFSGEEREEIIKHASQCATVIGRPQGDQVEFLICVGVWVLDGSLSHADFEECLEAVERRRPDNRFAYFRTCLKNKLAIIGNDLDDLVNTTTLPSKQGSAK